MDRLPSLNGLMTFDAVARHLSFSRAGRELHVTQAAVSHRIRALEEELGVRLFTRSPRKVELTGEGRVLFRSTQSALAQLRMGVSEMHSLASNRVVVSCSPSFAIRWLVPHLADLKARDAELDLQLAAEDRLVRPRVGIIDCCIRFGPGSYAPLVAEQLTEETVTPVCSPLYAKGQRLSSPEDLRQCQLLHDDVLADHDLHVGWSEWLKAAGVNAPSPLPGLRFSHSHMALDAATAGIGIALARRTLVRKQLRDGVLIAPFELQLESPLTYWLVTPPAMAPPPAVQQFTEWLRSALRDEDAQA